MSKQVQKSSALLEETQDLNKSKNMENMELKDPIQILTKQNRVVMNVTTLALQAQIGMLGILPMLPIQIFLNAWLGRLQSQSNVT